MTHALGRDAINRTTRAAFRRHCRPLPRLSMSEWATRYRVLSPEATSQHGPWQNEVVPYLVEIMDAVSDRTTQEITVVSPSQAAKTELLLNAIGFFIHQEPSPILVVQPTVETAESFSKDRVAPMIRDCAALSTLVAPARSRESNNTILSKGYSNGQLDMCGANAPVGLAMRPKRIVLLDERDRHPRSAGTEGDVKAIARARTRSFQRRRKIVEVSSPTSLEESLIWPSYLEGTQEVYEVPCPACDHFQTLHFDRLRWELDDAGKVRAESVRYACAACPQEIPAREKGAMLRAGRWTATAEARAPHKRSFHISGLVAAFALWEEVAQEFVTANGQTDLSLRAEMLRAFFNTTMGELFKDQTAETVKSSLLSRCVPYCADGAWQVPQGAGVLTAGVDIQHDRAEIVVRAWGVGEESWLIARAVLRGDAFGQAFWTQLDEYRTRKTWRHESGAPMQIRAMCIDAGDGAMAKNVYEYCAPRLGAGVFAIKGHGSITAPMLPTKPTKVKPGRLYLLGVNAIMERTYRRLGMTERGPGYLHFNEYAGERPPDGVPADYLEQLLSMVRARDEKSRRYRYVVKKGARNEVADAETYAYAALLLGPVDRTLLVHEVDRINRLGASLRGDSALTTTAPTPAPAASTMPWVTKRGGWRR